MKKLFTQVLVKNKVSSTNCLAITDNFSSK